MKFPSARTPLLPWPVLLGTLLLSGALVLGILTAADRAPQNARSHVAGVAAVDTMLVGGFGGGGTFREVLDVVGSDLSQVERELVGGQLDRIFQPVSRGGALEMGARLKVVYERERRPDASTHSVRVLAAQVAGEAGLHTRFFYEHGQQPGYYDDYGQAVFDTGAETLNDDPAWRGEHRTLSRLLARVPTAIQAY
ncbi:MAG TPA: hypothetical protein VF142_14425 [Longimicrobium sp.]